MRRSRDREKGDIDLFGIEREQKILKSNIRNTFTPHQPISVIDLLVGRNIEVQRLIEHLNTPGQHALLFGDRGVGKSSLANISANLLLKTFVEDDKLIRKRCDSTNTFVDVVAPALLRVGIDVRIRASTSESSKSGEAQSGGSLFGLNVGGKLTGSRRRSHQEVGAFESASSPSWVAEKLHGLSTLFLVDEVEALRDSADRHKLAELVKHLSDDGAKLKVLLVGIGETAADLTAGHKSVQRCLRETRLSRMSNEGLAEIIRLGEKKHNLKFSNDVVRKIISISSGYPHFTHLLALKASEDAIAEDKRDIELASLELAMQRAIGDAEGSLRTSHEQAVRSASTDEYKHILLAAAICGDEEFSAALLRETYKDYWKEEITQQTLNNYFKRLISDDGSTILRRLGKGVYKFSDPRMPSYIKIASGYVPGTHSENS